jgi:hypothetical protein
LNSWGAEEYSLCGSREFVEEYQVLHIKHDIVARVRSRKMRFNEYI